MLYAFFWVITRRLDFICRRLGALCLFHLHRQADHIYLPMKMEQPECSETSAYEIQTPGNYPNESIQQKSYLKIRPKFIIWVVDNGVASNVITKDIYT